MRRCGGQSPCYGSIQAAVNAAQPGDTVQIQAGSYVEQVSVIAKNAGATNPASRIVIQADPSAPVGSVVVHGSVNQCAQGHAIRIQQSRFVTIRGLTITGAGGAAIALAGGGDRNLGIHIERNRIVGNGGTGLRRRHHHRRRKCRHLDRQQPRFRQRPQRHRDAGRRGRAAHARAEHDPRQWLERGQRDAVARLPAPQQRHHRQWDSRRAPPAAGWA